MEAALKHWNAQHQLLRHLLLKDKDYQKAIPVFLDHHAAVHTAKLQAGAHWSWHDEVLHGLTPEQMRHTPRAVRIPSCGASGTSRGSKTSP